MLAAALAFAMVRSVLGESCHPQCKWLCDDPVCPAQCHPVCARPNCQMDCKPSECAKCEVHCEDPVCSVRCPKEMCEMASEGGDGCPKCQTVCRPAVCRTTCTAPEPNCSPLCEPTQCAWKCRTPTLCPKPKCQLTCEKPGCNDGSVFGAAAGAQAGCCPCNSANLNFAMLHADVHASKNPSDPPAAKPSLVELLHTMHANDMQKDACCPCTAPEAQ